MTIQEKKLYLDKPTIAYYAFTMYCVILIKEIIWDIDIRIVYVLGDKVRIAKLQYSNGRDYFIVGGNRIYLSDCMRV